MALRIVMLGAALALVGSGFWINHRADRAERQSRADWPPVGQLLEIDGVTVHALTQGDGPDVVLIHGAGGNLRDFNFSLVDGLVSRGYRVTAFDRPGLGYTGRLPAFDRLFAADAESPQGQAALLSRAADALGIETPLVLGHSYGGAVALAWGLDHPAAAIISVAGVAMPWPGELGAQYKLLGSAIGGAVVPPLVTAFVDPSRTDDFVASIFAPQAVPEGYLPHVGPGLSLRRSTLRANARQVNSLRPHMVTMAARYPDMTLPVEFVHGDADTIVPLRIHPEEAVAILPNANLTVLKDLGHMPHHANEPAILDAVDRAAGRAGLR